MSIREIINSLKCSIHLDQHRTYVDEDNPERCDKVFRRSSNGCQRVVGSFLFHDELFT